MVGTERLTLRPMLPSDRGAFISAHQVSREAFAPWYPHLPEVETSAMLFDRILSRGTRELETGTGLRLAAFLEDGSMAGWFNLNELVRGVFLCGFAGWSVRYDLWGQGLCTEGLNALLDLAFASEPIGLGLHRVQANIIPSNLASLRVAEKCGFRREGLAKRYLKIGGRWQDHWMTAKLAEEHTHTYMPASESQLGGTPRS